nr:MAG TPA: hypothetical protein [Bacteriophage sp.]
MLSFNDKTVSWYFTYKILSIRYKPLSIILSLEEASLIISISTFIFPFFTRSIKLEPI